MLTNCLACILGSLAAPFLASVPGAESVSAHQAPLLEPIAITTFSDRTVAGADFDLAGVARDEDFLVLLGAPNPRAGFERIRIEVDEVLAARPLKPAVESRNPMFERRTRELAHQLALRRARQSNREALHSAGRFPTTKSFWLLVREGAFDDVGSYEEVRATLVAAGRHCLIYVDNDDDPKRFPKDTIDETIETFDRTVEPEARRIMGHRRDVDRNGMFVILFSGWLDRLSSGKVTLGGFVRGGDFYRDLPAPFGNQCDMMYLNANLRPGPHLRTLIAHEYTHAITFCEHVFGESFDERPGLDEEAWLNEAISHLAENLYGDGWSNLDYRISTFLNDTGRYPLVVPDYFRAGRWRCHGCRGATYLFLRFLVDQYGEHLLTRIVQSNLCGVENIEVATGRPFAESFRDWSVAIATDGTSVSHGLKSLDLHGPLGERLLAGVRSKRLGLGRTSVRLEPTTFRSLRVRVPKGQCRRISVEAPGLGPLQVTVLRIPPCPRVSLEALESLETADEVRLTVRGEDSHRVEWSEIAWERCRLPQENVAGDPRRAVAIPASVAFPGEDFRTGSRSRPLDLTGFDRCELVFKLVGRDRKGLPVAIWGHLDRR